MIPRRVPDVDHAIPFIYRAFILLFAAKALWAAFTYMFDVALTVEQLSGGTQTGGIAFTGGNGEVDERKYFISRGDLLDYHPKMGRQTGLSNHVR